MENNYAYSALELIGWGKFTTLMFVQCGLAWTTFDSWFTCIAYILQGTSEEWGIEKLEISILASQFQVGMLIGCLLWGYISDTYGRKVAFKSAVLIASISSILLLLALNYYMAAIGLTLLGTAMAGELMLGGAVFCEFCPPSKRYFITVQSLFFCIGSTTISLFAFIISIVNTTHINNWRFIVGYGCFIQVISFILRIFMVETPPFLVSKGRFEEADDILNRISLKNRKIEFKATESEQSVLKDLSINNNAEAEKKKVSKFKLIKDLFSRKMIKTTGLLCIAYLSSVFSYAGTAYFMPEFLSNFSTSEIYLMIFLQQLVGVIGVLLGSWLVETCFGRKYTIFLPFLVSGICSMLFSLINDMIFVKLMQVALITSLLSLFSYLGFSALFTIAPESFPTGIRSTGMGLISVFSRFGGISAPLLTRALLDSSDGKQIILVILGGFYILSGVSVLGLKETRVAKR